MSDGTITTNRKARYEYFIEDTLEAGIELKGAEVKSLRDYQASIAEAYAAIEGGQVWLHGMHIAAYQPAADQNLDPYRRRKLLLRSSQIRRLERQIQQKGYTLIPLKLYLTSAATPRLSWACAGASASMTSVRQLRSANSSAEPNEL